MSGSFDTSFDVGFDLAPTTYPIDLIALAISRLPHCYRSTDPAKPTNTEKVLRALLSPAPALAQAMWDCIYRRSIDTAVGVQLDMIGAIVGRPRNGVADDEIYRRYCRAQISANKSSGIIEDILTIARLIVDDPAATMVVNNTGAAASILRVDGIALPDATAEVLVELVLLATSDGVRRVVEWSSADPTTVLRWDTQGIWDTSVWSNATDKELS